MCQIYILENPRWRRPPSCISENVNNSELDRAICTKVGLADASRSCGDETWPKVETGTFLRDVIIMMNKDVYINVGNIIGALMSRPTRALNLQIFSLSLCRTHLFALLSTVTNLSYVSYQQTLIKQQILYRKNCTQSI